MKIGLFIPCYINAIYPSVGVASYKLLTSLGLDVDYLLDQTCCGQPMANAGFEKDSTELAKRMEGLFEKYDYVVGPSASCVVFVKEHYPRLLNREEHACISSRIYEICEFLHDVVKVDKLNASFPHKVSIHNSCHGERLLHLSSPERVDDSPLFQVAGFVVAGEGRGSVRAQTGGRVLRFRGNVLGGGTGDVRVHGTG